ncbi:MAG: hypothetical protein VX498_11365 [Myxococcota bacterium]|nr:hypothetical protein [Myxococcota bacterium]
MWPRANRTLLSLLLLLFSSTACVEFDLPWFVEVEAGCAEPDPDLADELAMFEIRAELNHDRGPSAVAAVWVDVSFVEWDLDETMLLVPADAFDLEAAGDEGGWYRAVEEGSSPLECDYPFDFHFLFSAQDDDGDIVRADYINSGLAW